MAFLCPIRIPRRKRKKKDGENTTKNGAPKGRITGSNSVDSVLNIGKEENEEDSDFEPRKMVVLHDFIPCVEDETPVKRNEHVKALYQENDWVYVVKLDGKEGFVPYTYCVTEEEYEKRKEKIKNASTQKKTPTPNEHSVTFQDLQPSEFSKQNYGEFVVKFDFSAIDEDDITVRKGEIVVVLNKDDQDWFWVKKKSGREGFIPKDFVTKIEQIASRNLSSSALRSRSTPNIADFDTHKTSPRNTSVVPAATGYDHLPQNKRRSYHEVNNNAVKIELQSPSYNLSSPHTPVIYAQPFSSESSIHVSSMNNTKVIPIESGVSSSLNKTLTSQSSAGTPMLPNSFSSLSELNSALPDSLTHGAPLSSTFRNSHNTPVHIHQVSSKGSKELHSTNTSQVQNSKGRISLLSQQYQQNAQLGSLASRSYSSMPKDECAHHTPVINSRELNKLYPVMTHMPEVNSKELNKLSSVMTHMPVVNSRELNKLSSVMTHTNSREHNKLSSVMTHTPVVNSRELNKLSPVMTALRKNSNDLILNGQELVCTDTYVAHKADELTVYKGDWVYADMKSRDIRGWIWAFSPSSKHQGFVPKYCLRPPATTPL